MATAALGVPGIPPGATPCKPCKCNAITECTTVTCDVAVGCIYYKKDDRTPCTVGGAAGRCTEGVCTVQASDIDIAYQSLVSGLTKDTDGWLWKQTQNGRLLVMTPAQGLLLNYIGQDPTLAIAVCASKEVYLQRLKDAVAVNTQFDTEEGVQLAQKAYAQSEAAFQAVHVIMYGRQYGGSMLDYFTMFGNGLDWVPCLELFGPDNCPTHGKPLEVVLAELLPKAGGRRLAAVGTCPVSPSPAPGCGSIDPDAFKCISTASTCGQNTPGAIASACGCTGPFCPPQPVPRPEGNLCNAAGFMYDGGQNVCAGIRAGCQGPMDLYQELYSYQGFRVYCCRCVRRSIGSSSLPPYAAFCPLGWTEIQTGDHSFAWACSDALGMLSEGFTPTHCGHCEAQKAPPTGQRRRLLFNPLTWLRDVSLNGCFSYMDPAGVPAVSGLATAADVATAAGPRAIAGAMSWFAETLCTTRANDLEGHIFIDKLCTQDYMQPNEVMMQQCTENFKGAPFKGAGQNYPFRTSIGGSCYCDPFYITNDPSKAGCSGPMTWGPFNKAGLVKCSYCKS